MRGRKRSNETNRPASSQTEKIDGQTNIYKVLFWLIKFVRESELEKGIEYVRHCESKRDRWTERKKDR